MKQYDKSILNKLIDKYERSKVSKELTERNIQIYLKYNDSIFKNYWSDDSYLYRDNIDFSLDNLEKKEFITVLRDSNGEIEKVILNIDNINHIYQYLDRENPNDEKRHLIELLNNYLEDNEILSSFSHAMIKQLKDNKSVLSYIDNLNNLKLYLKAIKEMTNLEEDVLKRNFSKSVFNDSKLFERIENRVCKIIRDFSDIDEEYNELILKEFHIVNNPTYVYIKGDITIKINNQVINLEDYGHELALSSKALNDLIIINVNVKKILTIENLTTFVAFNDNNYIAIYLGGFHNSIKRNLLEKIYLYNNKLDFYHFGDIDAGGFLIFNNLVNKTGINFVPYMMDIETLISYKKNWAILTNNDKKRLKKIDNPLFIEVVNYMLENNCKLEQESILIS